MKSSLINDLLQEGQTAHVEYKDAETGMDALGSTVCSLLNSGGGSVLIGVDNRGKIQGVSQAANQVKQISERLQLGIAPRALWSVTVEHSENGDVILIGVPAGRDEPYTYDGRIYVRRGGQTITADPETIRRLVQKQYAAPMRWERLPSPGTEMTDLDIQQIQRTAEIAASSRNYRFQEAENPSKVLEELSLRREGQLTNGAEVLFGRDPSRRLTQTRARATVFASDKGGEFRDDRLFEGNAFTLLDKLLDFVQQHVSINVEFPAGKAERIDRPEYPFNALREGLVNALVHRDYASFSGGVSVGIYPTRIEIWNSGRLPVELKAADLKKPHPSLPQNPDIAHVFYLRALMERVGRGAQKILEECKTLGIPAPIWRDSPSGVTLVFNAKKLQPKAKPLNPRQRNLLTRFGVGAVIKPSDYYSETKDLVSQRQAQRDLTELESGGWLRRDGSGPTTIYIRTEKPLG